MKRFFVIGFLLTLFVGAVFAQSGVIREMSGEVTLKLAGTSDFVPAQAGSQIAPDTIVSTGFKSNAVIVIGSSTLMVRPLTRLTLSEIQASASEEKLNVTLQTGRIRVDVKPPAGARASATFQSPSATASVRGTEFEMDTHNLQVFEGSVAYQGSDGIAIPVAAGSSSSVSTSTLGSGGGAVDPFEMAAAELAPASPVGVGETGAEITPVVPVTTAPVTTADVTFEFDEWN